MRQEFVLDIAKHTDTRCRQIIADSVDLIPSKDEPLFYFVLAGMLLHGATEALAADIPMLERLPEAQRFVLIAGLLAHSVDPAGYAEINGIEARHLSRIASQIRNQILNPTKGRTEPC